METSSPAMPPIKRRRVRANGLEFVVAASETQERGGRLALCLHGFPECWRSWIHQFPALSQQGYRVWAPDMRGYGESSRPGRTADYSIEQLVDDVSGLIKASEADSVVLIGHDWGAIVAWFFAMRRPSELDRLVIMNVPHPAAAREGFSWRQLARSYYMFFFQLPWIPERLLARAGSARVTEGLRSGMKNPQNIDSETGDLLAENFSSPSRVKAMLDYYRALIRGGGARRQARLGFPVIEAPTLMIWGVNDVALTVQTTYATGDYVRDLTLRYLPEASHFVQQDGPILVNRLLSAWLSGESVPEEGEAEGIHVATQA